MHFLWAQPQGVFEVKVGPLLAVIVGSFWPY